MIDVYKLIGKRDLSYSDAKILKNKIKELLQKGEKVVVSFSGIEMIYPIFLQKSIGELYLEVEDIIPLDKIEFRYLNDDQEMLEYIIANCKNERDERTKMENQHRKIKGYRELNQEEIDAMNEVKAMGIKLGELVEKLEGNQDLDQRWIESGKTDLQKGLMALTRSIARPEFF